MFPARRGYIRGRRGLKFPEVTLFLFRAARTVEHNTIITKFGLPWPSLEPAANDMGGPHVQGGFDVNVVHPMGVVAHNDHRALEG